MKKLMALVLLLGCGVVQAASVDQTAFSSEAFVEDFESLHPGGGNLTPLFLNGNIYTTGPDPNIDKLYTVINGGIEIGGSGLALTTVSDGLYIDIVFGEAANMVGLLAGSDGVLGAPVVEFFDDLDNLVGTVAITSDFFGGYWNQDGLIRRVRITDTSIDGSRMYIDDLRTEYSVVPIPATVWLFGSGLGLLGWFRRRQSA